MPRQTPRTGRRDSPSAKAVSRSCLFQETNQSLHPGQQERTDPHVVKPVHQLIIIAIIDYVRDRHGQTACIGNHLDQFLVNKVLPFIALDEVDNTLADANNQSSESRPGHTLPRLLFHLISENCKMLENRMNDEIGLATGDRFGLQAGRHFVQLYQRVPDTPARKPGSMK